MEFQEELRRTRIVPVIVIKDLAHAVPLARALVEGGLNILEITMRTAVALDAIKAIAAEVPGAIVGAGTVIDSRPFRGRGSSAGREIRGQPRPDRRSGACQPRPSGADPARRRHRLATSCGAWAWG